MLNSIKVGFIVLLTLFTSLNVQAAGGIALGATRVIYPSAAKQMWGGDQFWTEFVHLKSACSP